MFWPYVPANGVGPGIHCIISSRQEGNNGQSIQVRSFIKPLDDHINWLLRLRAKAGQRLPLIVAGSEARPVTRVQSSSVTLQESRENVAMNKTGLSISQRATISLMWVLCQFTSHRLDLGHHHLYYNKLIYNNLERNITFLFFILDKYWKRIYRRKLILLMLLI